MITIIAWLVFCIVVGKMAEKRGRSFWTFTLISAVISPIGGFIVLLISGKKDNAQVASQYECPEEQPQQYQSSFVSEPNSTGPVFCTKCGAVIDSETKFCPACGAEVERCDSVPQTIEVPQSQNTSQPLTNKEKLLQLKALLDEGLISQDDFNKKKSEILGI